MFGTHRKPFPVETGPLFRCSLGSEDGPRPAVEPKADNESLPDLNTVIARHIRKVLDAARGKIHGQDGAGAILGVNPNTLRAKMRKLGIPLGRAPRMPATSDLP